MKYLQGSPTGSDRAGHRGACPLHAVDDSQELRRVLAPSLVDRACSPMPEASSQQLPLSDMLMAVKHQMLDPWTAQHPSEAQQQKDALVRPQALPAAESKARSETDESLAAEQTQTSVGKPMSEQNAGSTVHSPNGTQLRMLDSIQLGQMHSTADLASSEASPEAEQQATESSPEPATAHALLCNDLSSDLDSSDVIASQVEADIAAAEEEATAKEPEADLEAEDTVLRLPSDVGIAVAAGDSPAADSEASSADSFDEQQQQPDWHQQWAQLQSKQQQQQHATARRKQSQPSKLMKSLAAAAVAEQSEPISAIFERHSQLAEPCAFPAAATHMVSRVDAGLEASSTSVEQHVGRPGGAELLSENSGMAEDAGTLIHYAQVSSHVHGGDQSALHAEQAQHAQQAQHLSGRQAEVSSAASKRSLMPAVRPDPYDSSAETSPEAAKNSRMKMRRTSGEFQQVVLPCIVWLKVFAPTKQTAHGSCLPPHIGTAHCHTSISCHNLHILKQTCLQHAVPPFLKSQRSNAYKTHAYQHEDPASRPALPFPPPGSAPPSPFLLFRHRPPVPHPSRPSLSKTT